MGRVQRCPSQLGPWVRLPQGPRHCSGCALCLAFPLSAGQLLVFKNQDACCVPGNLLDSRLALWPFPHGSHDPESSCAWPPFPSAISSEGPGLGRAPLGPQHGAGPSRAQVRGSRMLDHSPSDLGEGGRGCVHLSARWSQRLHVWQALWTWMRPRAVSWDPVEDGAEGA